MKWGSLNFQDLGPGIQRITLDITDLFQKEKEQAKFRERLSQFMNPNNSDLCTAEIYETKDGLLAYETESIIPEKRDDERTPLLMFFGNPASHSVKRRMFFSFERNRKEHRFWKVFAETRIFPFESKDKDLDERNQSKKRKLLGVGYDSPFVIGLVTFYSMPSPSTGKWAGVAGIRRLLRKRAFEQITSWEKERIENLISEFVVPNGLILAFQKDTFLEIRKSEKPGYSLKGAIAGLLKNKCQRFPEVDLYCLPPTRLMYASRKQLKEIVSSYTKS